MKKNKLILSIVLIIQTVIWGAYSFASEPNWYAKGLQAESAGDSYLAIEQYKKSAANGLSDAKFALGRLYRDAYSNSAESVKWFIAAAKQGNVHAQYEVGLIYLNGTGSVLPDRERAKNWFVSAASKGNYGNAAYELFRLSSTNEDALKWLRIAAEQGVVEAMQALSEVYRKGMYGMAGDKEKGQTWLERARQAQE